MEWQPVLERCPLFDGLDQTCVTSLLTCIAPVRKTYPKNAFILREEDQWSALGIVLSGALHSVRDDYWGKRTIVDRIEAGGLFGEAFVCGGMARMPVSILAAEPAVVLLIDFQRVIRICSSACAFHITLIKNMMATLARKNLSLMEKIEHLTQPTTREKVLSYLSALAKTSGTPRNSAHQSLNRSGGNHRSTEPTQHVTIPFNRQEMAEYLAVDRSALSAELSRMEDEGLIRFHKNRFEIREERSDGTGTHGSTR